MERCACALFLKIKPANDERTLSAINQARRSATFRLFFIEFAGIPFNEHIFTIYTYIWVEKLYCLATHLNFIISIPIFLSRKMFDTEKSRLIVNPCEFCHITRFFTFVQFVFCPISATIEFDTNFFQYLHFVHISIAFHIIYRFAYEALKLRQHYILLPHLINVYVTSDLIIQIIWTQFHLEQSISFVYNACDDPFFCCSVRFDSLWRQRQRQKMCRIILM